MRTSRTVVCIAMAMAATSIPRPADGQQVAEVQVAPVTVTLGVGERRELLASAYDARGDNVATARFVWASSNPGVVRVEEDPSVPGIAILIGVGQGLASVEALVGNRRASAAVQVTAGGGGVAAGGVGAATVLQIDPGSVFLLPSEDVQLQARFLKDDGSPAAPRTVTWRSLRADVATVTPQGSVVAVSPGQGVIEATAGRGLLARVTVQVAQTPFAFTKELLAVSPNMTDTVWVTVPQQNHRRLSARRLLWRSTNDAVARVSPLGGVTGVGPGTAEIIVTGFGQESRLPVTVHRPVELLELVPRPSAGPVAVPLGGSVSFSATPMAADETPVPEAPVTWLLPDTGVATFDLKTGRLTGKVLGETELSVRAPGEGLTATWTIKVIAGGLSLDPQVVTLRRGDRAQIEAAFTDKSGRPVSAASGLTWISTDPAVVEVDEDGRLSPVGFGAAQVIASTPWAATDTTTAIVQGEVLVTSTRGGSPDVYAFDPDAPDALHQVTNAPGSELNPVYSPDGTKIVYVSDAGGNLDLLVAQADGSNTLQLTSSAALEGSPSWTPDGSQIVYESDADGSVQIWIMNADGSNQRQLTSGEYPSFGPTVSPNGQTIAFTSARDDDYEIYLMNLDGSNQRNFTSSATSETMPAWVGDSAIAYVLEEGRRRSLTRRVVRLSFSREREVLTPEGLVVTDFAISAERRLLAAIVSAQGPAGLESRLYLIPLGGDATPIEVRRDGPGDQLMTPSIRR